MKKGDNLFLSDEVGDMNEYAIAFTLTLKKNAVGNYVIVAFTVISHTRFLHHSFKSPGYPAMKDSLR